ncbi:hypothetical protein Vi05172_g3448 [Venturia inaequalis]|nr:hypothetical protein Vi05172_g3448 [Venturia inaequalis]
MYSVCAFGAKTVRIVDVNRLGFLVSPSPSEAPGKMAESPSDPYSETALSRSAVDDKDSSAHDRTSASD